MTKLQEYTQLHKYSATEVSKGTSTSLHMSSQPHWGAEKWWETHGPEEWAYKCDHRLQKKIHWMQHCTQWHKYHTDTDAKASFVADQESKQESLQQMSLLNNLTQTISRTEHLKHSVMKIHAHIYTHIHRRDHKSRSTGTPRDLVTHQTTYCSRKDTAGPADTPVFKLLQGWPHISKESLKILI